MIIIGEPNEQSPQQRTSVQIKRPPSILRCQAQGFRFAF